MADIKSSLLKAIQTVVDSSLREVIADVTITATVLKPPATLSGETTLTYAGGRITAYAQENTSYMQGDAVYVLVPEGNFSNKKIILGLASTDTSDTIADDLTAVNLDYNVLGSNLFKSDIDSFGLCSQKSIDGKIIWCSKEYLEEQNLSNDKEEIFNNNINIDINSIENSILLSEAIMVKSRIKTSLNSVMQRSTTGQYGLSVGLVYQDPIDKTKEKIEVISLTSINNMSGNPLAYYSGSNQYQIYKIDKENFKRIEYIMIYSKGFVSATQQNIELIDDIFFKDIHINLLSPITATNGNYSLSLSMEEGNAFSANSEKVKSKLPVTAKAKYLKTDITDEFTYYWGSEDLSVTSYSSDGYNQFLGEGWRYLEDLGKTEKFITYKNSNTAYQNNYVCAAVLNKDGDLIVLKEKFVIFNESNKLTCHIESNLGTTFQFNVGKPILTCIIDEEEKRKTGNYRYIWSKEDATGNIIFNSNISSANQLKEEKDKYLKEVQDNNGFDSKGRTPTQIISEYANIGEQLKYITFEDNNPYSNMITYDVSGLSNFSSTIFRCTIQKQAPNWVNIATGEIELKNVAEVAKNNYRITINNGSQVFQYSETGVSPASISVQDPIEVRELIPVFRDPNGTIIDDNYFNNNNIKWIVPTESTMIDSSNLLLFKDGATGETYFTGKNFPLSIVENYDINTINNQLVCVITYQGEEFRQETDLTFTKIGQAGTNGTSTVVKIVPQTEGLDKEYPALVSQIDKDERKYFWNFKTNNEKPYNEISPFYAQVYSKNELLAGAKVSWRPAGSTISETRNFNIKENDNNEAIISAVEGSKRKQDVRVATAKVNFGGKTYYNSYPIYTIDYNSNFNYKEYKIKINKPQTLQYITYDSNGMNPQFNTAQGGISLTIPSSCYVSSWKAQGGDGAFGKPAFALSKMPGTENGSYEINVSSVSEDILIQRVKQVDNLASGIIDANLKTAILQSIEDIKYQLSSNLIISTNVRINNIENILNILLEEAKKCDKDVDKNIIYAIINIYTSLISKSKKEIESIKNNNLLIKQNNEQIISNIKQYYNNEIIEEIKKLTNSDTQKELEYDSENNISLNEQLENYHKELLNSLIKVGSKLYTYIDNEINIKERENSLLTIWKKWYDINNINNILERNEDHIFSNLQTMGEITEKINESYINICTLFEKNSDVNKDLVSETLINLTNAIAKDFEVNDKIENIYIVPAQTYNGIYVNNYIEAIVKDIKQKKEVAIVKIPLHLSLNTYELASINGWDGTHINIDEENNSIVAPQIGAGVKDIETNKFTGLVMGSISNAVKDNESNEYIYSDEKVGLIGYNKGMQSIFLDAKTGSAEFGTPEDGVDDNAPYSEGRIKLVPGGVSEISKWKIGKESLYNVKDGDVVKGTIHGWKDGKYFNSWDTPGDFYIDQQHEGVIISADPAFFSIKGRALSLGDDKDIINNNNIIKDGDSFGVEINPHSRSIFSIYHYPKSQAIKTDTINGKETTSYTRYALAGIDNKGRFFSNSMLDEGGSIYLGGISAFGKVPNVRKGTYVGASIQMGENSEDLYDIAKFFIEDPNPEKGGFDKAEEENDFDPSVEQIKDIVISNGKVSSTSEEETTNNVSIDGFILKDNLIKTPNTEQKTEIFSSGINNVDDRGINSTATTSSNIYQEVAQTVKNSTVTDASVELETTTAEKITIDKDKKNGDYESNTLYFTTANSINKSTQMPSAKGEYTRNLSVHAKNIKLSVSKTTTNGVNTDKNIDIDNTSGITLKFTNNSYIRVNNIDSSGNNNSIAKNFANNLGIILKRNESVLNLLHNHIYAGTKGNLEFMIKDNDLRPVTSFYSNSGGILLKNGNTKDNYSIFSAGTTTSLTNVENSSIYKFSNSGYTNSSAYAYLKTSAGINLISTKEINLHSGKDSKVSITAGNKNANGNAGNIILKAERQRNISKQTQSINNSLGKSSSKLEKEEGKALNSFSSGTSQLQLLGYNGSNQATFCLTNGGSYIKSTLWNYGSKWTSPTKGEGNSTDGTGNWIVEVGPNLWATNNFRVENSSLFRGGIVTQNSIEIGKDLIVKGSNNIINVKKGTYGAETGYSDGTALTPGSTVSIFMPSLQIKVDGNQRISNISTHWSSASVSLSSDVATKDYVDSKTRIIGSIKGYWVSSLSNLISAINSAFDDVNKRIKDIEDKVSKIN